ncbi:hypothetical protein ABZ807_28070 [Micromonospora sp. NPDC047548]
MPEAGRSPGWRPSSTWSNYGWELVNITSGTGSHFLYAFMRRP